MEHTIWPIIDPIALSIGPLSVRWYALSYIAGLLIGWRYSVALARRFYDPVYARACDDIFVWLTLGVILGGRIGYVVFYHMPYYLASPASIFRVWEGGMSFHGGLIGVIVAMVLFCRHRRIAMAPIFDLIAAVTPIGLFFGRVANFINGELYGRVSDVPWAIRFRDGQARHPSQLYEAMLEGVVLFILLQVALRRYNAFSYPWRISGLFLVGYGVARMSAEVFRAPDAHIGFLTLFSWNVTWGQILTLPMVLAGVIFFLRSGRKGKERP